MGLNKLDIRFKWWAKAATRQNVRGRAGGGHLVGIKKSMSDKYNVEEWMYGMVVKIVRETDCSDVWIITVYRWFSMN